MCCCFVIDDDVVVNNIIIINNIIRVELLKVAKHRVNDGVCLI